ncbi:MAG TPA: MFS transporter [Pseudorhodoplanes sp.]|nr:MFS transporter [Pseudorhodoplanes sp.]
MNRSLIVVGFVAFATSLSFRAIDPSVALIALDFSMAPERAALLSTAFALPYALGQPVLGPIADAIGKTRVIRACVVVLLAASLAGAVAPDFQTLLVTRIAAGVAAGGIFPTSIAVTGDLVPVEQRQVALGRLLACALSGSVLGATVGGLVGDVFGWRGILLVLSGCSALALAGAVAGFPRAAPSARFDISSALDGYRRIFANPLARFCYGGVLVEGACVFGLLPFVAVILHGSGEERATIAGLVVAGFPVGGVILSVVMPALLAAFGQRGLMRLGGALVACALLLFAWAWWWPFELAAFVVLGFGFYMIHTGIQVFATELAPGARASAVALHAMFFFLGQGSGPVLYGFAIGKAGVTATIAIAAVLMVGLGLFLGRMLRHPKV